MSEENVGQTPEATEPTTEVAAPEPTLDDVYKEAGALIQPEPVVPREPQAPRQPAVYQQPQEPVIPDPYDTAAYKAHQAAQMQGLSAVRQDLSHVASYLQAQVQAEQKRALEADVSKQVGIMQEITGLKPKLCEALLDAKAREDKMFTKVWNSRSQNPEILEKAVKAYSREIAAEYSVKVDPKLQQAQQARKIAQSAMATTAAEPPDAKWDGLKQDDFSRMAKDVERQPALTGA